MSSSPTIETLYRLIQGRPRPEEVAQVCLQALDGKLSRADRLIIDEAARGAKTRDGFGYSSMSDRWANHGGIQAQLESAARIFPDVVAIAAEESDDVEAVAAYVTRLNAALGKSPGESDFKQARLPKEMRRAAGLEMSRRAYNRAFRFVAFLEERLEVLRRETRKAAFARVAKTRLLAFLPREEITGDLRTACFLAYFGARCNLRSEFTNGAQVRAFDTVSETLLNICFNKASTNWWAIAHLYPDAKVLARLSEAQRGELLGKYAAVMDDIAGLLREVWQKTEVNTQTMIVRRGNDSTTWNNTAGAWNRAREGWFALVEALGIDALLDELCPGKVPRLMAADVAYWHRATGGDIHPDTRVWAELPLPWEVFSGEKACGRAQVEEVCARHGVNAEKTGWTQPRPSAKAVAFTPTPELVHGCVVTHPVLAKILRDMGVYSGKKLKNVPGNTHLN